MNGLFCDGGVILQNPSPYGGTWAWCLVENDLIIKQDKGLLKPKFINSPTISNNVTELYAALRALEAMASEWKGILYTDSQVTCHRLKGNSTGKIEGIRFGNGKKAELLKGPDNGIPVMMKQWLEETLARGPVTTELVSGHPTKLELLRGTSREGRRVSLFNVWCDRQCTKLARQFLKNKAGVR